MLYVTPTSKKDVPDNTPALHIAAHKVPNANWNAEIFKVRFHCKKRILHELSFHMKFMKHAFGKFHKFHMK